MKWLYPEGIYKWQFHLRLQSGCSRITFVPHHILQPLLFFGGKEWRKKDWKTFFLVPYIEIKALEIYVDRSDSLTYLHWASNTGLYQLRLSDGIWENHHVQRFSNILNYYYFFLNSIYVKKMFGLVLRVTLSCKITQALDTIHLEIKYL